jgi:hypothetical protein
MRLLEDLADSVLTALTYRIRGFIRIRQGELFAKSRSVRELSVVALRHPVECKGGVLPKGGKGTVVHVYGDGEHYEVEFAEPFPCTITLRHDDIHPE